MKTPNHQDSTLIGDYLFSESSHNVFTDISGDKNPIHYNKHHTETGLTSNIIVHGMHMLLVALDLWSAMHQEELNPNKPTRIKCRFISPVSVNETALFTAAEFRNKEWKTDITTNKKPCAIMTISKKIPIKKQPSAQQKIKPEPELLLIRKEEIPRNISPDNLIGKHFILPINEADIWMLFTHARNMMSSTNINAIISCSYFAGMICPGLYSLCTAIDITTAIPDDKKNFISFYVDSFDTRFNTFTILLDGAISGTLTVLKRSSIN
jgi:hypothetical protein